MKYISKRFKIGSLYFFEDFPDFKTHDLEELVFIDKSETICETKLWIRNDGYDLFIWKKLMPEEFIQYHLSEVDIALEIGKFLIPEVNEYLGFTIEHLKQLETLFNKLDENHLYEQKIFNFYIINNKFELTESQLNEAYLEYKKYRV